MFLTEWCASAFSSIPLELAVAMAVDRLESTVGRVLKMQGGAFDEGSSSVVIITGGSSG